MKVEKGIRHSILEFAQSVVDEHQQRLDKVLSKFIKVGRGMLWNCIDVRIFYNDEYKTFALNHELNIIKLGTVESLIKDLEAQ